MHQDLTEAEMRAALFGESAIPGSAPAAHKPSDDGTSATPVAAPAPRRKPAKTFTPRLCVTLQVSNEYEGKTFELVHHADTLSTLLAEQEAVKAARKKFRYIEVLSVKPM